MDWLTSNSGHLPSLVAHLKAPVEKALKEQGSLLELATGGVEVLT